VAESTTSDRAPLKPEVRAAWQHEYGDDKYALDSSFANAAGNAFSVVGPEIGRDSLLLSAGVAVQLSETVSTYLYYDGELFREDYLSTSVTGGVRVSF
jgi:outer membrane autotransporter protein